MTDRLSDRNIVRRAGRIGRFFRFVLAGIGVGGCLAMSWALSAEPPRAEPVRIAVYDVPPYGYVDADGSIAGVSVDLWRRIAQDTGWQFKLTPVSDMEAILSGLEQGRFDAAIGAITITPERSERVDFSYPAHRSGVAVAFRKESGPLSALASYGAAAAELSPLIIVILAMLVVTGLAMWFLERPRHPAAQGAESSVVTLRDGIYWAVVTMTTVGYGDKTPKTNSGRFVAILWMMGSLVLVSLLSTSMVSRLTAERVESGVDVASSDLVGKRLAAAAYSSGRRIPRGAASAIRKISELAGRSRRAGQRKSGRGRQQRRRLAVFHRQALRQSRAGAARPSGAGLYGRRAAGEQPAEKADQSGADENHLRPGLAGGRTEVLRPVTGGRREERPAPPLCALTTAS